MIKARVRLPEWAVAWRCGEGVAGAGILEMESSRRPLNASCVWPGASGIIQNYNEKPETVNS